MYLALGILANVVRYESEPNPAWERAWELSIASPRHLHMLRACGDSTFASLTTKVHVPTNHFRLTSKSI